MLQGHKDAHCLIRVYVVRNDVMNYKALYNLNNKHHTSMHFQVHTLITVKDQVNSSIIVTLHVCHVSWHII